MKVANDNLMLRLLGLTLMPLSFDSAQSFMNLRRGLWLVTPKIQISEWTYSFAFVSVLRQKTGKNFSS